MEAVPRGRFLHVRENRKAMKKTQNDRVVEYLQEYGSITALQAMRDLGVMRLASRIHDLRNEGYDFDVQDVAVKNRYGTKSYIAKYSIKNVREYQTPSKG